MGPPTMHARTEGPGIRHTLQPTFPRQACAGLNLALTSGSLGPDDARSVAWCLPLSHFNTHADKGYLGSMLGRMQGPLPGRLGG